MEKVLNVLTVKAYWLIPGWIAYWYMATPWGWEKLDKDTIARTRASGHKMHMDKSYRKWYSDYLKKKK